MPDNTTEVIFDFKDAAGNPLRDRVRITCDNLFLTSLNRRISAATFPATIELEAAPNGHWKVFIQPEHYRAKDLFLSLSSSEPEHLEQFFFLQSGRVRPKFPKPDVVFSAVEWQPLADLLDESEVEERSGVELYTFLIRSEKLQAASLLNLQARMRALTLASTNNVFSYLEKIVHIQQDRIYATVKPELHDDVMKSVKKEIIKPANGSLHEFPIPGGFVMLNKNPSFKTPEKTGNLQLTFAKNAAGEFVTDIDMDEAQGLKHGFEVLGHLFSGNRTHPFDIHQILLRFYKDKGVNPGYELVPD